MLLFAVTAAQLVGGGALAPVDDVAAQALSPDGCLGDEAISFAPAEPVAGEDLLVVARSSKRHRGVWLHSSDRAELVREYPGQTGWVWNWRVTPASSGDHRFRFYVDSTSLCAEAWLTVGPSTAGGSTNRVGGQLPTSTATPTATRRRDDNENSEDDNGNDNSGRRRTPTPTAFAQPNITSLSTSALCPGIQLTISGSGFGSPRSAVDGQVLIAGKSVGDYLLWRNAELVVVVPDGGETGESSLIVVTLGGFDEVAVNFFSDCGG